ncbi:MAG: hypothetical protein ACO1OQ_07580 [Rufibacter sp.]
MVQAGDTLTGWVERTDEVALGLLVHFKPTVASAEKTFGPGEINGYGFTEAGLHFRPVQVSLRRKDDRILVNRFAKVLLTGPVNLSYLRLQKSEEAENNEAVFLLQKDTLFHTLALYPIRKDNAVGLEYRYRGTLSALFKECPILQPEINRLPFKPAALVAIVKKYAACVAPSVPSKEFKFKVPSVLKHGAEIAASTILTPGHDFINNSKGVSLGYFWDLQNPDISRKISYRYGINYLYLNYSYDTEGYSSEKGEWTLIKNQESVHYLRIPVLGQFNFASSPTQKLSPYLSVGLTPQVSSKNHFEGYDFIPFFTLGTGFYVDRLRVDLLLDNEGFLLNSDKIVSFSLGWRLDNPEK